MMMNRQHKKRTADNGLKTNEAANAAAHSIPFARALKVLFDQHLHHTTGASRNTVDSYRTTFRLETSNPKVVPSDIVTGVAYCSGMNSRVRPYATRCLLERGIVRKFESLWRGNRTTVVAKRRAMARCCRGGAAESMWASERGRRSRTTSAIQVVAQFDLRWLAWRFCQVSCPFRNSCRTTRQPWGAPLSMSWSGRVQ